MITDVFIELIVKVIGPFINGFLPHLSLSSTVTAIQNGAGTLGSALEVASPVVPWGVVFDWLGVLLVVLPVLGGYMVFQWVWDHIPSILGFGTG